MYMVVMWINMEGEYKHIHLLLWNFLKVMVNHHPRSILSLSWQPKVLPGPQNPSTLRQIVACGPQTEKWFPRVFFPAFLHINDLEKVWRQKSQAFNFINTIYILNILIYVLILTILIYIIYTIYIPKSQISCVEEWWMHCALRCKQKET